jgi:hypothetical protein
VGHHLRDVHFSPMSLARRLQSVDAREDFIGGFLLE